MFQLKCKHQEYHWGAKGEASAVARLLGHSTKDNKGKHQFVIDKNKPYAELWMGCHPSAPSRIIKFRDDEGYIVSDVSLLEVLQKYPEYAGTTEIVEKYGKTLPFLFKVLSVAQPLSIQAHPDKQLAKQLHEKDPKNYPDDNHKPEMAIALTHFHALCGFRPHEEILQFMNEVPELKALVGDSNIESYKSATSDADKKACLKKCFTALMTSEQSKVAAQCNALIQRLSGMDGVTDQPFKGNEVDFPTKVKLESLILWVAGFYPGDIGVFVIYFLNYILLQPSESVYLGANEPHAYLKGDCVECMANSDNVVRAGLTPKFKDVETLCNMLTYRCEPAKKQILHAKKAEQYIATYMPGTDEFRVDRIAFDAEVANYNLPKRDGASILIVTKGTGRYENAGEPVQDMVAYFDPGFIGFIPARSGCRFQRLKPPVVMYRAYTVLRN